MGPQNAVVGDSNLDPNAIPTTDNVPVDPVVAEGQAELQKAANFAKSTEYKELKKHLESRIDFYKRYLPNGDNVLAKTDMSELGYMWLAANVIIGECNAIMTGYEQAAELLQANGNG